MGQGGKFIVMPLTLDSSNLLFGSIGIGNPRQNFTVLIDTGSSAFWVTSSDCSGRCGRNSFFCEKSNSCNKKNKTVSASYNTGSIRGQAFFDTVSIGGSSVNKQFIVGVNEGSNIFSYMAADGVLGLPATCTSDNLGKCFLRNLVYQGLIDREMFSIRSSENKTYTEIIFGSSGATFDTHAPIVLPIHEDSTQFWALNIDRITVGEEAVSSASARAILDTGTPLIVGPLPVVSKIQRFLGCQVHPNGYAIVEVCRSKLCPDIYFEIGNNIFALQPSDYLVDCDDSFCFLGIITSNDLIKEKPLTGDLLHDGWILGSIFLRNYNITFDAENRSISFAKL
ncbi:Hypothetical protein NTJ_07041 [Nesidiocoris tenuis]|uniref:Peptidase A1 domain-containing protein n=1 Tax=Nesidiocoris tenuis TaxID=355587 RepID=A0ABN7ASA6_9HEMI|nr:Hypothetical protein NTJ_07041 [Nesidiocoris tenuis]